ncbi:hypothetical protein ACJX0J_031949, partial [Zea mays]
VVHHGILWVAPHHLLDHHLSFIKHTAHRKQYVQPKTATNTFQLLYNSRVVAMSSFHHTHSSPICALILFLRHMHSQSIHTTQNTLICKSQFKERLTRIDSTYNYRG